LVLYLVDTATGARVTGQVSWAPVFEALCKLCAEVGIVVECESVEDESVALFWQAPVWVGDNERFTGECQASTAETDELAWAGEHLNTVTQLRGGLRTMMLKLTTAQQHAILQHLQTGSKKPIAPFPLSLLERGLSAVFDGGEAIARRVVAGIATLLRLPKAT
jgi:hypothetical protein